MKTENEITYEIISAAIEVHRFLGPGMLESCYHRCLEIELKQRGLQFRSEVPLPIIYKDSIVQRGYRIDLIVEEQIIVELKAVDFVIDVHHAQILTYLKLSQKKLGLLINFNVPMLKSGIYRKYNSFYDKYPTKETETGKTSSIAQISEGSAHFKAE